MYSSHVFARNGIYYYRADIPHDIQHYFPIVEIKQSLKTKDPKTAKVLAVSMEYKLQRTYAMIRSGLLSDDMVKQVVDSVVPNRQKAAVVSGKRLSGLMDDYVKEKESEWTYKTKLEVTGCHRLIMDVLGDVYIKSIDRQVAVDFRDKVMKLPANLYKCFPGKTINEVLSLADIQPMSIQSVNKYILRLNALLGHAVKSQQLSSNPAQGLMLNDKRRDDELRKTYSTDEIKSIVSNLPRDTNRPERYWIPIIAMHSGLRLDEICQLYVCDIQRIDDVWCFSVNDEFDKKVKVEASKRIVPVHPKLIESGFLQYVEGMKGYPRLWMKLSWRKEDGYSNGFGNWFRRFNRQHVTDDPQKVFHSFRHNVADTLKQKGVSEAAIAELLGHAHASITTSRYGKRYQPKVLLDALEQLDYGVTIPEYSSQTF